MEIEVEDENHDHDDDVEHCCMLLVSATHKWKSERYDELFLWHFDII
jgi:hypothetical protein